MSQFNLAIQETLKWEGGFTNNPSDPGGVTKYGIEQREMPDKNIADITVADAIQYYQDHYWKPYYSEIASQAVASKIFDAGVNMGIGTAVRILQKTLGISVDGAFGPNTLAATNEAGESVLPAYKAALAQHYQDLVAANPKLGEFLAGWLRRANS